MILFLCGRVSKISFPWKKLSCLGCCPRTLWLSLLSITVIFATVLFHADQSAWCSHLPYDFLVWPRESSPRQGVLTAGSVSLPSLRPCPQPSLDHCKRQQQILVRKAGLGGRWVQCPTPPPTRLIRSLYISLPICKMGTTMYPRVTKKIKVSICKAWNNLKFSVSAQHISWNHYRGRFSPSHTLLLPDSPLNPLTCSRIIHGSPWSI